MNTSTLRLLHTIIACASIGAGHLAAFTVSYDLITSLPAANTTRMDNDERYDQMTVSHNIQSTTSAFRVQGDLDIADTLDSFEFSSFQISAAAPISMSFDFDLGLQGSVPYTITLDQMRIDLPANTSPLQLQLDGQFSPYMGTQQNLTATYSYTGTIDILGATTPFSFTDTTALDIIQGELDQLSPGVIQLQMRGKFGGGQNTIYTGIYQGNEIEIGLINDHFYEFTGIQIPEPTTAALILSSILLGLRHRSRTPHQTKAANKSKQGQPLTGCLS